MEQGAGQSVAAEATNNGHTSGVDSTKKKGKGLIVGTIIFALLAVGGVGFGVYELLQGQQKDSEISDLNAKVESANGKIAELEVGATETTNGSGDSSTNARKANPVIKGEGGKEYSTQFAWATGQGEDDLYLELFVVDGEVSSCSVVSNNSNGANNKKDCKINGLTGKIYKVDQVGEGQDGYDDIAAFIMEDGSVEYLSLRNALEKSDFTVKKLSIDGFVVDVLGIGVHESGSGYNSSIFVFANGDYVKYDKSMLK